MILIEEYIKQPQAMRQQHLRLDEPCIERGGSGAYASPACKGLLAHVLDTTIPKGNGVCLCHACHNSKCHNPNHLYWGTSSENSLDAFNSGGLLTPKEYAIRKHGLEKANAIFETKVYRRKSKTS